MQIKQKVNEVIASVSVLDELPENNSRLREDLGFDSLHMVQLLVSLEDAFEIIINESDLNPQEINTTNDLYNLIAKYVEA